MTRYNWIKWRRGGQWVDNDEGYNYQHCASCGRTTEHDLDTCIPCTDRMIKRRLAADVQKAAIEHVKTNNDEIKRLGTKEAVSSIIDDLRMMDDLE